MTGPTAAIGAPIVSKDSAERVVTAPVLVPDEPDRERHWYSEESIARVAKSFLPDGKIDAMHAGGEVGYPTESWVAKSDETFDGRTVPEGSWLVSAKVTDDRVWNGVASGDLTGVSIFGPVRAVYDETGDALDIHDIARPVGANRAGQSPTLSNTSAGGVSFSGTSGGKLDESDIPSDDFKSHYLYPGDTKSESAYPVVDGDGNLRKGNVVAAYQMGARGGVSESDLHSKLKSLNDEFDSPPFDIEDGDIVGTKSFSETGAQMEIPPAPVGSKWQVEFDHATHVSIVDDPAVQAASFVVAKSANSNTTNTTSSTNTTNTHEEFIMDNEAEQRFNELEKSVNEAATEAAQSAVESAIEDIQSDPDPETPDIDLDDETNIDAGTIEALAEQGVIGDDVAGELGVPTGDLEKRVAALEKGQQQGGRRGSASQLDGEGEGTAPDAQSEALANVEPGRAAVSKAINGADTGGDE